MEEKQDSSYRLARHKKSCVTSQRSKSGQWLRRSFYVPVNLLFVPILYLIFSPKPRWPLLLNQNDVWYCLLNCAAAVE